MAVCKVYETILDRDLSGILISPHYENHTHGNNSPNLGKLS
jgi:hypothetical protein